MTDPSKRYWITEQGMKEAAEEWFGKTEGPALADLKTALAQTIAAHSEAASPPEPDFKALCEMAARVLLQHMNDEDYEMSLAGLVAKLTEHTLAAAPPQGTPGIGTEANSHPEDGGPKEIAWEAQGSVPNLDITPGGKGKCVSCGTPTIYICPFCKIKGGKIRWLCERPECRDAHETIDCARTPSSWGHSTVAAQNSGEKR